MFIQKFKFSDERYQQSAFSFQQNLNNPINSLNADR